MVRQQRTGPLFHPAHHELEDGSGRWMLQIELWRGPLMKSLSEILTTVSFPMTEEGLEQTVAWLEEQATILNAE